METSYFAITSTYLPFFLPLTVPPLRACGGPSKSSIELAVLSDVAGRGGGPEELPGRVGGAAAPVETDRGTALRNGGGAPSSDGAGLPVCGGGAPAEEVGRLSGPGGLGEAAGGGALLPLAVLLGGAAPLGGGGVPRDTVALLGSFLLTHFLSSLS